MKKLLYGSFVIVFCAMLELSAWADQENYVWTAEYSTPAKGSTEIEFWSTAVAKNIETGRGSEWTQQVELEYGITDHLAMGIYQVVQQPADSSSLNYAGSKLEMRYRLLENNELPLNVLFYAEHEVNTKEENVFEGKLVLAKDIGKLNFSYNQILERGYSTGDIDHQYAVGISYEVANWLRLGVESKGSYTEGEYSAGPTLTWMGSRIWANLGVVYGLNNKTDDREVRFLLGIPF